jgi:hypothetical protein
MAVALLSGWLLDELYREGLTDPVKANRFFFEGPPDEDPVRLYAGHETLCHQPSLSMQGGQRHEEHLTSNSYNTELK